VGGAAIARASTSSAAISLGKLGTLEGSSALMVSPPRAQ
jgi:hypothetical protein